MYKYSYKGNEYDSWEMVKTLDDFKNTSFPKESLLTDELLGSYGITRTRNTIPQESLATIKNQKMIEIEEWWNKKDDSNINVSGLGVFKCDMISRNRILGAISALGDGAVREWTLVGGEKISVTKEQLLAVISAWSKRSDEYHEEYEELKKKIDESTTKEDLRKIRW